MFSPGAAGVRFARAIGDVAEAGDRAGEPRAQPLRQQRLGVRLYPFVVQL